MVEPVTILATMAATNVINGIYQSYQRQKAAGAAKRELEKIKAVFDAIVPPEFDLDIEDPPEVIAEVAPLVEYDFSKFTPQMYEVVGTYAPEIAPLVKEQAPQLIEDTAIGVEGLEAQQGALRRLQQIADGGIDPQFAQRMHEAERSAQGAAQSRQESILQDYARRGLLGSGGQLASDLSAAEGAMERGAAMSQDAATQAYLNQLQALQGSAALGGQIRGQELDIADRNAAIANAYNQRTSAAYQKYYQDAANTRNEATLRNLREKQGVFDKNVALENQVAIQERNRDDILKEKMSQMDVDRTKAENEAAMKNWENKVTVNKLKDDLKQQQFMNQIQKAQGATGGVPATAQAIQNQGQAKTDAAQGVTQGINTAILTGADMHQRGLEREAADARNKDLIDALRPARTAPRPDPYEDKYPIIRRGV